MDLNIPSPLPERRDFRIGLIGSGFIVNDCHLPAYRKAGFNPVDEGDIVSFVLQMLSSPMLGLMHI